MMKINKKTVTWIVGLLAAILTAAVGYMTTSCSASKSAYLQADSVSINRLVFETKADANLER